MSQLILTAHSGSHDAGAALFEDYNLLAAVQLERLTRYKCDGREHPDLAIDEALSIAGKTHKDIDAAGFSRTEFSTIFLKVPREFLRYNTTRIDAIFKVDKFRHAERLSR
jgi:predicted NodU family carbamoyl transferase